MSRMVTKVEGDDILLWVGYEGFDPLSTQRKLNASGLTLKEIRDDKWAVLESLLGENQEQEARNG